MRAADLRAISPVTLSDEVIETLLSISEADWSAVASEALAVLERVMRQPIRDTDLDDLRNTVPMQVSVRLNALNAAVVSALVRDLIVPNRALNQDATQRATENRLNAIAPETRTFEAGQVIIQAGTRVTDLDLEALTAFNQNRGQGYQLQTFVRSLLTALLTLAIAIMLIVRTTPTLLRNLRDLWIAEGVFLIGVVVFGLVNTGEFTRFLFPAAAVPILILGVAGLPLALGSAVLQGFLFALLGDGSLQLFAFIFFGSAIGALVLRRTERLTRYFFVGLVIGLVNASVVLIFALGGSVDAVQIGWSVLLSALNGMIATTGALIGLYVITLLFNLPTSIRLLELSLPNQELLQRLLREAPGTYQHSLQVANLAEQAANEIGADVDLVRVAALYHDVGKMQNAVFFVENQAEGSNPHDSLNDPFRSADIIISHVPDGDRLARQYGLPRRIRQFIWEHHGTTRVAFFLNAALGRAGAPEEVDQNLFAYPGPKPRSRESGILMLADSCESVVRARKPANKQEIAIIVREVVESRIADGQLDECELTLRDIEQIRRIFVEMLQGVYHPRINYPGTMMRLHTQEAAAVAVPADAKPRAVEKKATREVLAADDEGPVEVVPSIRKAKPAPSPDDGTSSIADAGSVKHDSA